MNTDMPLDGQDQLLPNQEQQNPLLGSLKTFTAPEDGPLSYRNADQNLPSLRDNSFGKALVSDAEVNNIFTPGSMSRFFSTPSLVADPNYKLDVQEFQKRRESIRERFGDAAALGYQREVYDSLPTSAADFEDRTQRFYYQEINREDSQRGGLLTGVASGMLDPVNALWTLAELAGGVALAPVIGVASKAIKAERLSASFVGKKVAKAAQSWADKGVFSNSFARSSAASAVENLTQNTIQEGYLQLNQHGRNTDEAMPNIVMSTLGGVGIHMAAKSLQYTLGAAIKKASPFIKAANDPMGVISDKARQTALMNGFEDHPQDGDVVNVVMGDGHKTALIHSTSGVDAHVFLPDTNEYMTVPVGALRPAKKEHVDAMLGNNPDIAQAHDLFMHENAARQLGEDAAQEFIGPLKTGKSLQEKLDASPVGSLNALLFAKVQQGVRRMVKHQESSGNKAAKAKEKMYLELARDAAQARVDAALEKAKTEFADEVVFADTPQARTPDVAAPEKAAPPAGVFEEKTKAPLKGTPERAAHDAKVSDISNYFDNLFGDAHAAATKKTLSDFADGLKERAAPEHANNKNDIKTQQQNNTTTTPLEQPTPAVEMAGPVLDQGTQQGAPMDTPAQHDANTLMEAVADKGVQQEAPKLNDRASLFASTSNSSNMLFALHEALTDLDRANELLAACAKR